MGLYKELNDFYNDHQSDMTSDQVKTFKAFLKNYYDEQDFMDTFGNDDSLEYDDNASLTTPEIVDVDYQQMKQHVRQKVQTREENPLYHYAKDLDGEINNIAKDMLNTIRIDTASQHLDTLPKVEKVYFDKPTVRKRRKQWGGVPTYRKDFDSMKAFGYILRSYRKLMKLSYFTEQDVVSSMRRSISHIYFKEKVTPVRTQEMDLEEALYDAYFEYVHALFTELQEDTEARKIAWEEYIDYDVVSELIKDSFAPTTEAFMDAEHELKEKIANQWNEYRKESFEARAEGQNKKLTKEQVDKLPNADKSYMK